MYINTNIHPREAQGHGTRDMGCGGATARRAREEEEEEEEEDTGPNQRRGTRAFFFGGGLVPSWAHTCTLSSYLLRGNRNPQIYIMSCFCVCLLPSASYSFV